MDRSRKTNDTPAILHQRIYAHFSHVCHVHSGQYPVGCEYGTNGGFSHSHRDYSPCDSAYGDHWQPRIPPRQEQIIVDYLQPHTIYRLFGGEVHMLSDAMICRSGAKLLLILPEEVDVIKTMKYSGESTFVRGVWITTDTMKKYRLEFMSGQQQNIKHIVMWLKHKKPEITWQRNS